MSIVISVLLIASRELFMIIILWSNAHRATSADNIAFLERIL